MQQTTNTKSRGLIWPVIVVGLLLLQIGICAAAIIAATSDKSHAVESNYHAKALTWDEQQAMKKTLANLGWQFNFDIATKTINGQRLLTLKVLDKDNLPIGQLPITLEIFHHAKANQIYKAKLKHNPHTDIYSHLLPMKESGIWELIYQFDHDGQSITARQSYLVSNVK